MYCVIQEITLKKPNKYGAHKELEAYPCKINGLTKYAYRYTDERFDRTILKAYKISIHKSKRLNGVVTKKQCVVTTVDYYTLAEYGIEDFICNRKLIDIAKKMDTDIETLRTLIYSKVRSLQNRIIFEFEQTEEYKTKKRCGDIVATYKKSKDEFAEKYNCDSDEYDYCYDVFGKLMNPDYLKKIVDDYMRQSSYQSNSHSNYNDKYSDFNWDDYKRSYSNTSSSNYTENEKAFLKKFYRLLSKEYHPDNPSGDTAAMQLINKLKNSWQI